MNHRHFYGVSRQGQGDYRARRELNEQIARRAAAERTPEAPANLPKYAPELHARARELADQLRQQMSKGQYYAFAYDVMDQYRAANPGTEELFPAPAFAIERYQAMLDELNAEDERDYGDMVSELRGGQF